MRKKILMFGVVLLLALFTSGCVGVNSKKKAVTFDGGVYKTLDSGNIWQQKTLISTVTGAPGNFGGLNLYSMAMDSSDENTLYFGSINNGLFYTYDGGASWQAAKSFGQKTIHSVAVDEKDHCNIYVGSGNRIYKSEDCTRTWQEKYYDNEVQAVIDAVVVDHYDNQNVYAAISRGDVIKSQDGGNNWQTLNRFGDRIKKMMIDPNDSRIVYVVTTKKGVFRSDDGGLTWNELEALREVLTEEKLGLDIRDLLLIKNEPGTIFLATYYGLLRSIDSGETWDNIKLILPSTKATINALAVDPINIKNIFYVTNTTFYRSNDGGENWATLKLPTTRAAMKLFIDPQKPSTIYMGVK